VQWVKREKWDSSAALWGDERGLSNRHGELFYEAHDLSMLLCATNLPWLNVELKLALCEEMAVDRYLTQ